MGGSTTNQESHHQEEELADQEIKGKKVLAFATASSPFALEKRTTMEPVAVVAAARGGEERHHSNTPNREGSTALVADPQSLGLINGEAIIRDGEEAKVTQVKAAQPPALESPGTGAIVAMPKPAEVATTSLPDGEKGEREQPSTLEHFRSLEKSGSKQIRATIAMGSCETAGEATDVVAAATLCGNSNYGRKEREARVLELHFLLPKGQT